MKIAVIADSHFDTSSRFDECIKIHRWIAKDIAERDVDLVIHTGDVFERKSNIAERNAVAEWLQRVADHCPVFIVRGNHDAVGDLEIFGRLEARHPVRVEEACGVRKVQVPSGMGWLTLAGLGWPQKARLRAMAEGVGVAPKGLEAGADMAADVLRDVLRGLGAEAAFFAGNDPGPRDPILFVGHAMVRGSMTSLGQPLVGCDFEIGLEDLALVGADAYLLGHIHMPQDFTINDAPVIYPGSPRRTAFGEVEEKGYVLLNIDDVTRAITWERVTTPARQMLLLEDEWLARFGEWSVGIVNEVELLRGCEVRFRYKVDSDAREAGSAAANEAAAKMRREGAVLVKLEEVVNPVLTARAPEVAEANTVEEKLDALWKARGDVPTPERAEVLLRMAAHLEEDALGS